MIFNFFATVGVCFLAFVGHLYIAKYVGLFAAIVFYVVLTIWTIADLLLLDR